MVRSLAFDAGLVGSGPLDRMDRCCLLDLPCSLVLLGFRFLPCFLFLIWFHAYTWYRGE
jgi:hypothetical protein